MKRILTSLAILALVFASLMMFPAFLHWMALCWVLLALIAFTRNKPMWPWLVGFTVILTIKRPGFTLEFLLLTVTFISVAYFDWRSVKQKFKVINLHQMAARAVILLATIASYGVARWFASNTSQTLIADGRPIACLGDSLTDFGYPQSLEKLISVPVADFGVNGISTDDGIEMIPEILAADPQLVVIELGGHDYNGDRKTRVATRSNLIKIIDAFDELDIAVIIVEIPRGFVSDPYDGLERELASKYDLQLIDGSLIRSFVFNSPIMPPGIWLNPNQRYSDDGLHPNSRGNEHFARVVCESLVKIFGDSILN